MKTSHERVLHRQELCESELKDEKANLAHTKQVYDEKIKQLQKRNMEQDIQNTQVCLIFYKITIVNHAQLADDLFLIYQREGLSNG